MIPGAYERNTLTHRQPGSMGAPIGAPVLTPGAGGMDAAAMADRQREGGGAPDQRTSVNGADRG